MKQNQQDLDDWYTNTDPWDYKTTPDDIIRKSCILDAIQDEQFTTALDLGCGEGWITQHLPADKIYGYDISDVALSRLPKNVQPIHSLDDLKGSYDLIVATGVLYDHYNYEELLLAIYEHKGSRVLTSHIEGWEVPQVKSIGKLIYMRRFPYREYRQILRVYDTST